MRKKYLIFICILCFLIITCSGKDNSQEKNVIKDDIFILPWGTEYSKAKKMIEKQGLEIIEETPYMTWDVSISSYIAKGKYEGKDNAGYTFFFYENKFCECVIDIGYDNEQITKLRTKNLIDKLTKKLGTPKEIEDDFITWENNDISTNLSIIGNLFNELTIKNIKYSKNE